MPTVDRERLEAAYQTALAALLAERTPGGYWVGELSTSALSTATAVGALTLMARSAGPHAVSGKLIEDGLRWLVEHQNDDGGWGDTDRSFSNISTTMLCRAALVLAGGRGQGAAADPQHAALSAQHSASLERAAAYMDARCGAGARRHAAGIRARYGQDRTFSVPILMMAALAGLVPWDEVPALPFELACLPQSWFRFARLPVVSYALPALIAIGQAVCHHRPPRNPLTRAVRRLSRGRSLQVLERIQPASGGFLEAVPLTSFVVMSLASIGLADHPVARKGVEFLVHSVRPDGSWPIDSNLSVWVTTLSITALAAARERLDRLPELRDWLLAQQVKERHPYTGADPGGWGWTHLPGSVPDCDDTPGAIIALRLLSVEHYPEAGIGWVLGLQNRDGGWPTFCRGWGRLPFDRSGADLSAHALRALAFWKDMWQFIPDRQGLRGRPNPHGRWILRAVDRGLAYLASAQRPDGSWVPLWFGNQRAPADENPTYGTARVLAAYRDLGMMDTTPARRGIAWLLAAQNADGSWGGAPGVPGSVEETALAVEVLLAAGPAAEPAVGRGLAWLVAAVEAGSLKRAEPIGFYFAKLWYYEKLYPMIFTVAALGRARLKLATPPERSPTT